jgi:hypothetical protein
MPLSGETTTNRRGTRSSTPRCEHDRPMAGGRHRHRLLRPLPKVSDRGTGALERRGSAPSSAGAGSQTQQWELTA